MRRIAARLPSPALVVAFVALLVALGGGAYAAVKAIPGGAGVVHTCYLKQGGDLRVVPAKAKCARGERALALRKDGVPGPAGAKGATGPQGPVGGNGPQGATGPRGPGTAFTTRVPLRALVAATPLQVAALQLPAGSYVITSTLWLQASSSLQEVVGGLKCSLDADGDRDESDVQIQMSKTNNGHVPVSLSVTHTSNTSFAATLTCSGVGGASNSAVDTELTAIQVGSVQTQ